MFKYFSDLAELFKEYDPALRLIHGAVILEVLYTFGCDSILEVLYTFGYDSVLTYTWNMGNNSLLSIMTYVAS